MSNHAIAYEMGELVDIFPQMIESGTISIDAAHTMFSAIMCVIRANDGNPGEIADACDDMCHMCFRKTGDVVNVWDLSYSPEDFNEMLVDIGLEVDSSDLNFIDNRIQRWGAPGEMQSRFGTLHLTPAERLKFGHGTTYCRSCLEKAIKAIKEREI